MTVAGRAHAVVIAEPLNLRLRGLAGIAQEELVPLLIPRCRSVHTFGMRAAIDVVWVDLDWDRLGQSGAVVLAVRPGLPPRRLARAPRTRGTRRRVAALELPAGSAAAAGLREATRLELAPID